MNIQMSVVKNKCDLEMFIIMNIDWFPDLKDSLQDKSIIK